MLSGERRALAGQEEAHWWFRARRRILARLLRQSWRDLVREGRRPAVVDLGCGAAIDLETLAAGAGLRVGIDAAAEPLAQAVLRIAAARSAESGAPVDGKVSCGSTKRGATGAGDGAAPREPGSGALLLVRGGAERVPLRGAAFDWVLALDVLEHLQDDAAAFAEAARLLKPGGRLILTVPAWPRLWSEHDETLGHRRRYLRGDLIRRVRLAGLELERATYLNCLLFLPAALYRLGREFLAGRSPIRARRRGAESQEPAADEGRRAAGDRPGPASPQRHDAAHRAPVSDAVRLGNFGGTILEALFAAERFWLARWNLPFGLSLLAVARKL